MFDGNSAIGFCMVLAIIIFSTKFLGLLFRKLGLPQVLGYIIAGILIGPALFGDFLGVTLIGFEGEGYHSFISLKADNALSVFSKLGVLFLMFSAGLETNLQELKKTGVTAVLMALAGVLVPLLLGFLLSLPFSGIGLGTQNIYRCLFIGVILTATSVAITVSVLKEMGKINTKLGTTIVSAALIDDVIGIILLSVMTGMAKSGNSQGLTGFEWFKAQWWGTVIMIVLFFIVAFALGILVIKCFKWLDKRWPATHRIPVFSITVCLFYSWMAEEIFGVADITGAFFAGALLSTAHRVSEYTDKKIEVNTYTIFAPAFFANIGISNIKFAGMNGSIVLFSLLIVVVGLIGKIVGCGAVCKGFKYSWRESAIGGVGMMARGEVALIVTSTVTSASLGVNALPSDFMLMTVLLILVSSILTPILLKTLYGKEKPPKDDLPPAQNNEELPPLQTEQ